MKQKSQGAESCYTKQQLSRVDLAQIPKHVAIIPDGNRRWAKKHAISTLMGHKNGSNIIQPIVRAAQFLGVRILTLYIFSTENWQRSRQEVNGLMNLLKNFLVEQSLPMQQQGVRLQTIGKANDLPKNVGDALHNALKATENCREIDLVLALNYGGRDEMCRAVKSLMQEYKKGAFSLDAFDEELFSSYLDTAQWPDPELLIRTSDEHRLSNFLLWQTNYTEIYFSPVLWPDFSPTHFLEAIIDYQGRHRRRGA